MIVFLRSANFLICVVSKSVCVLFYKTYIMPCKHINDRSF